MGRKIRSAPASWAWVSWTVKSVEVSVVKVASPATVSPSSSALATNWSRMPVEYTSSFFQMMKMFSPRPWS